MGFFEKNKLPAVADVEQCCATGVTSEGKAPRTLVEDMVPLLGERSLSSKDKIRIIALYILFRDGVPEEDRKRLFQHARLALHEMDMVNNLKFLGLDISKELKTSRKPPLRQRQQDDVYDISRYQPIIKLMLDVSAHCRTFLAFASHADYHQSGLLRRSFGHYRFSVYQGRSAIERSKFSSICGSRRQRWVVAKLAAQLGRASQSQAG